MMMTEKLINKIPYKRTLWIFGFVKTSLSGALFSTGVVLIFNGITNHPWFQGFNEIAIVSGLIALTCAIIVIASIDKWREHQKKNELETIDNHIDERAEEIAEKLLLQKLEELGQLQDDE
ncbi:MAG: hypothetical protein IJ258_05320 [Methanobrevibacter sp.]|uniref:hypothetical protein n=1 Tax=Methanobrevibacter sp. TaxID=66852 RepID=UPI0025DB4EF6|nr:hypothetical protein [Methanobrevibacter sp.]MBQ8017510.1 hypothetical protein [Methanobrevibacter sp.]